jgi:hypothetical protein
MKLIQKLHSAFNEAVAKTLIGKIKSIKYHMFQSLN